MDSSEEIVKWISLIGTEPYGRHRQKGLEKQADDKDQPHIAEDVCPVSNTGSNGKFYVTSHICIKKYPSKYGG